MLKVFFDKTIDYIFCLTGFLLNKNIDFIFNYGFSSSYGILFDVQIELSHKLFDKLYFSNLSWSKNFINAGIFSI